VAGESTFTLTLVELTLTVKSTTWNVTLVTWLSDPLLPVTVTLLLPAVG